MNAMKILAICLILGGAAGLAYGQFRYTKETHDAKIGPIEFSIKDQETVHIPAWLAAAAMGGGVLLLFSGRRQAV
jgi:hypothetical protein